MFDEELKEEGRVEVAWYEVPYRPLTVAASWLLPIGLTLLVFGMAILHHFITEQPRDWDFGAVQDVPGQSIYASSSLRDTERKILQQLLPMPEASPLNQAGASVPGELP